MGTVVKLSKIKVYWMEQTIIDYVYEEDANQTSTGNTINIPNGYITYTNSNTTTPSTSNWTTLQIQKKPQKPKQVEKKKKLALIPIYFNNHIYFVDRLSAYDLYNEVDVTREGVDKQGFGIYTNRYNKDFDILNGKNFVEKFPILEIRGLQFRTFFTEEEKIGAEPL